MFGNMLMLLRNTLEGRLVRKKNKKMWPGTKGRKATELLLQKPMKNAFLC